MTSNVPRDPEHYWPSTHAKDMRRDRGVEWDEVSDVIKNGTVKPSHKEGCCLFIGEGSPPPYCVAHIGSGKVITIGWRK